MKLYIYWIRIENGKKNVEFDENLPCPLKLEGNGNQYNFCSLKKIILTPEQKILDNIVFCDEIEVDEKCVNNNFFLDIVYNHCHKTEFIISNKNPKF